MAWTDITFPYGSRLTSTKMTQLYNNVHDLACVLGGIPSRAILGGAAEIPANGTAKCSGNIAAVTRVSTGTYTATFSTNFAAGDSYIALATPGPENALFNDGDSYFAYDCYVSSKSASSLGIIAVRLEYEYDVLLWTPKFSRYKYDVSLNLLVLNTNKIL